MPDFNDIEDLQIEIDLTSDTDIIDEEFRDDVDEEIPDVVVASVFPAKKINYLNNKDMLKEIHKSKNSFCEYTQPLYADYDLIVDNLNDIFLNETIELAKTARAARLAAIAYEAALSSAIIITKADKPRLSEYKIKPDTISKDDLVFRVLGFEHIPLAPGRKKNPKSTADSHTKLNFFPFKHYVIRNGIAEEVGKSHSKNGKFSLEHGSITNKLAKMFILMVNKYGQRGNWRSYSYLEEMKGQALLQLSHMALQFDEYKSDNPFAYYTSSISNSFTRVFNLEKRNQDLRDDLLIDSGASPSFSRQLALEHEIKQLREDAHESAKLDH